MGEGLCESLVVVIGSKREMRIFIENHSILHWED